jgi:hypothetical protein
MYMFTVSFIALTAAVTYCSSKDKDDWNFNAISWSGICFDYKF